MTPESEGDFCPRWFVKVRWSASSADPRAAVEIPAAYFVEPSSAATVTVWLEPEDPQIEQVFDVLHTSLKTGAVGEPIVVQLGQTQLRLNAFMQAELHEALTALLIGIAYRCAVETEPLPALQ